MTPRIDIISLFPGMFRGPFDESILKRATQAGLLELNVHDLRGYATDRHQTADDAPFGGGPGLVLKAPPVFAAVEHVVADTRRGGINRSDIILLAAQGRRFTQRVASELAKRDHLVFVCGHYEGIDR